MPFRTLIVLSEPTIGRLLGPGGLAELEGPETYYVASERLAQDSSWEQLGRLQCYLGELVGRDAKHYYAAADRATWAHGRRRVFNFRVTLRLVPAPLKRRALLEGLPGVYRYAIRRHARHMAPNPAAHALLRRLRPDVVIASAYAMSGRYAALDLVAAARELGIPSLFVQTNWDYLTGSCFPVLPDYLAAWGPQSIQEAVNIHGFDRDHVFAVGSPHFQRYFDLAPSTAQSPFPFKYALFAGTWSPFDERAPIEAIDRTIERLGLGLKLVYRPYPGRAPRKRGDFVDERALKHVVIDPDRRDEYLAAFDAGDQTARVKGAFHKLEYLPALLANAEFIVCPMTTVMLEAALFDKRVVVPAYNDGINQDQPFDELVAMDHIKGIRDIEHFALAQSPEEVSEQFERAARSPSLPPGSLRDHPVIRRWLYYDTRPYAQRLREVVELIVERHAGTSSIETARRRRGRRAAPATPPRRSEQPRASAARGSSR